MAKTFSSTEFFEMLGVEHKFDREELEQNFKALMRKWHPDRFANPDEKSDALKKVQQISEAYHVLRDPNLRRYYEDWCRRKEDEELRERSAEENRVLNIDNYIGQDKEGELFVEGMSLMDEGDAAGAATRFKMALHIAPSFLAARFFLGKALLRMGGERIPEGRKLINEVIQRDPSFAVFLHEAQPRMENFAEIDRDGLEFEEIVEEEPEPPKARPWWKFGR